MTEIIDITAKRQERDKSQSEYAFDLVCYQTQDGRVWAEGSSDTPRQEYMEMLRRLVFCDGMEEEDPMVALIIMHASGYTSIRWDDEKLAFTDAQKLWMHANLDRTIDAILEET